MPYKRPLVCRQAFGIKNKIAKTQGKQFFHIFQTELTLWKNRRALRSDGEFTLASICKDKSARSAVCRRETASLLGQEAVAALWKGEEGFSRPLATSD